MSPAEGREQVHNKLGCHVVVTVQQCMWGGREIELEMEIEEILMVVGNQLLH